MIRSEQGGIIPLDQLTEHSARELHDAGGLSAINAAEKYLVWEDDKFLLAFDIRPSGSFLYPAGIFMVVGKAFGRRHLRQAKAVMKDLVRLNRGLSSLIDTDHPPAVRLAEFFGFRPSGSIIAYANRRLQLFEVFP